MSVDISMVCGFGLKADDYPIGLNEEGWDEWSNIEDRRITVAASRSFDSVEYYLLIPGDTLEEILDNEESFYSAIMEYTTDLVDRSDMVLIKKGDLY